MKPIVISVDHLGKQYQVGARDRGYRTLREHLVSSLRRTGFWRRRRSEPQADADRFWAVEDVSFQIAQGEVAGIIGRNGAGKSTLLKLLSRITAPTRGQIEIVGRVGSLLEVGTGFHPELTGRENIYLNGAILGMHRQEIDSKFDAIVEFAEVERFIDTPVKRYSSGMYLRLAFAVAAHLEPEILIVDEVLAVGDASFQKKCLGKMDEVSRQGRTVLFVSHNMVAVEKLCNRCIVLDRGRVAFDGATRAAVDYYMTASGSETDTVDLRRSRNRSGTGEVHITACESFVDDGNRIRSGEAFTIRIHFACQQKVRKPAFAVSILTRSGTNLFSIYTSDLDYCIPELSEDGSIDLRIDSPNLLAGTYSIHLGVGDELTNQWYDLITEGLELNIEAADIYGSGRQRTAAYSVVFYDCAWQLRSNDSAPKQLAPAFGSAELSSDCRGSRAHS
jgi:lipopolysaccharide transport system ATP-binding protein